MISISRQSFSKFFKLRSIYWVGLLAGPWSLLAWWCLYSSCRLLGKDGVTYIVVKMISFRMGWFWFWFVVTSASSPPQSHPSHQLEGEVSWGHKGWLATKRWWKALLNHFWLLNLCMQAWDLSVFKAVYVFKCFPNNETSTLLRLPYQEFCPDFTIFRLFFFFNWYFPQCYGIKDLV